VAPTAAEGPEWSQGVEVVLDELAAERADEELVGDGDEHAAQVGPGDRTDLLAGVRVEGEDPMCSPSTGCSSGRSSRSARSGDDADVGGASGIWVGIVSNALLGGIRLDSCDDSRPDDSMRLSAPRLLVAPTRRSALRSR
jgi:hypothetical protein